jgi:hypothetical protein
MLLCGCTKTGRTLCAEHRPAPMNDYATVKIFGGPRNNYELVWFEDKKQWFIRSTEHKQHYIGHPGRAMEYEAQSYSATGYDTKLEATKAFESEKITYTSEAPGQS